MKRSALASLRLAALLGSTIWVGSVSAAVLFLDTFDRPDSNNIDFETTGISGTTSGVLPPDGVYGTPWVDPANQTTGPDGNAANGGGQRVLGNTLNLKYQPGTANAFVQHNFTDAAILTAGGFAVSLDVQSYTQSTNGQGTAIAVGMSLAEAQAGLDAFSGTSRYSNALRDASDSAATVLSDFFFAIRGDSKLAWGVGNAAPITATLPAKTGTIAAIFRLNSFAAGAPVTYELFHNGVGIGSGSFAWSGNYENYIGIDGRDSTLMQVDNFMITAVPEPASLVLAAITLLGAIAVRRK